MHWLKNYAGRLLFIHYKLSLFWGGKYITLVDGKLNKHIL